MFLDQVKSILIEDIMKKKLFQNVLYHSL